MRYVSVIYGLGCDGFSGGSSGNEQASYTFEQSGDAAVDGENDVGMFHVCWVHVRSAVGF